MKLNILYEDSCILVCEKPAGVPSQSDHSFDVDMVSHIKNYLYETYQKNNAYVGIIHRLDRPVGGVMVFALTKQAAGELSRQITEQGITKEYLALVNGMPHSEQDTLIHYLVRDGKTNLSKVVHSKEKDAKEAVLSYELLTSMETQEGPIALLKVMLKTGRHHQIRVQTRTICEGIVGDTKYNPLYQRKRGYYPIGLYAYHLAFRHPVTKKGLDFLNVPKESPFDIITNLDQYV